MDTQAAAEDAARPVAVDQLLLHVVGEVRRGALLSREMHVVRIRQRRLVGAGEVRLADVPLVEQVLQHDLTPVARRFRVRHRVELRGVARDAGQQRRLGPRHVPGLVMEVRERRLLDPVGAVPEVDRVQVGGQDLVLRPALFELPRERRLLQLPADRALVMEVRVLDELLRDRRAALDDLLVAQVLPDGADDAVDVDAAVLVEALVLDRDDRVLHLRRDVLRRHEDPALRPAKDREHPLARVGRVDVAVDLLLLEAGGIEGRDLARDRRHQTERERDQAEQAEDQEEAEQAQLSDSAPRSGGRLFAGGARHEKRKIVTVELPRNGQPRAHS